MQARRRSFNSQTTLTSCRSGKARSSWQIAILHVAKLKKTSRASLQEEGVKATPPPLYRGVKVNSATNGKIEKDIKRRPTKNRHVYKSYLRLVPTSNGGRRFLVAGNGYFEGSARRGRPSPARGDCWGSPSRITEVARSWITRAEGPKGR